MIETKDSLVALIVLAYNNYHFLKQGILDYLTDALVKRL